MRNVVQIKKLYEHFSFQILFTLLFFLPIQLTQYSEPEEYPPYLPAGGYKLFRKIKL